MIYFVDGFVLDKNPSPRGGGFTVVNERGELIVNHTILRPGFTNNDGELLAIGYAAFIAQPGDTIVTDSECAAAWVASGLPKKRRDLATKCQRIKSYVWKKQLTVRWQPRDENLAGHYNETMERV
jgi:ribonuclease HI